MEEKEGDALFSVQCAPHLGIPQLGIGEALKGRTSVVNLTTAAFGSKLLTCNMVLDSGAYST